MPSFSLLRPLLPLYADLNNITEEVLALSVGLTIRADSRLMASTAQLDSLRKWVIDNGGYIHPSLDIVYTRSSGVHVRATKDIGADDGFCTVPHSLALSSLNAHVDDDFTALQLKQSHLTPHAVGYLYLMHQHLNRHRSFWRSYLETLPQPEDDHQTPFWFDDQDLAWLRDTDVYHTTVARKEIHEKQYQDAVDLLKKGGFDPTPYTWNLFMWAVTMFTSRSFSSQTIHPQESKYWAAYKIGPQNRRQTVLLDLSRTPAQDRDFPVLFPVADAANHRHNARAEWMYDPGRFSIHIKDPISAGTEMFNNYGPKGNAELLLGYGFCIVDNPFDGVLLTLKPPPGELQSSIRNVHPGYFSQNGEWSGERVTFNLGRMTFDNDAPAKVFENIPEPLLELMYYILRHERGLAFAFVESPLEHLRSTANGRRYLPHIARMIVQSLAPKLRQLDLGTPDGEPVNQRQAQAKIYRDGQRSILESITSTLRSYTRSMLPLHSQSHTGPRFLALEHLYGLMIKRFGREISAEFWDGIEASTGTQDLPQLRHNGMEDDLMVLQLCYMHVHSRDSGEQSEWMRDMLPEYLATNSGTTEGGAVPTDSAGNEALEHAEYLMQTYIQTARGATSSSAWHSPRWSASFIASFGGRFILYDSIHMMVPTQQSGGEMQEEARPVVYIHMI